MATALAAIQDWDTTVADTLVAWGTVEHIQVEWATPVMVGESRTEEPASEQLGKALPRQPASHTPAVMRQDT